MRFICQVITVLLFFMAFNYLIFTIKCPDMTEKQKIKKITHSTNWNCNGEKT